MYGNGGVLEIRPSGRGAETTGKGGAGRRRFLLISINLIEVVAMVMTAYVMIDMKGEIPRRRGEAVLMRADNEAAVTWVRRYRGGGKKQARAGALMRIMGALEAREWWCFQARHVRGVENRLADGLARWKEGQILQKRNAECPAIAWQVQDLGTGEHLMCSEILREVTHLEELQLRLEGLTRRIRGCG